MSDYIMTIDSDTDDSSTSKNEPIDDAKLDPDFVFDLAGDPYSDFISKPLRIEDLVKTGSKPVRLFIFAPRLFEIIMDFKDPISVDEIIARRRLSTKRKRNVVDVEEAESDVGDSQSEETNPDDEEDGEDEGDTLDEEDPLATSDEEEDQNKESEGDGKAETNNDQSSEDESDSENETQAEKDRKLAFFDSESRPVESHESFLSMNLS